jgi:hypothetical protein
MFDEPIMQKGHPTDNSVAAQAINFAGGFYHAN